MTMTLSTHDSVENRLYRGSTSKLAKENEECELANPSLLLDLMDTCKLERVAEGNQGEIANLSFSAEVFF